MGLGKDFLVDVIIIGCIVGVIISGFKRFSAIDIKKANKEKMHMMLFSISIICLEIAKMMARHYGISIVGTICSALSKPFTGKEIIFVIVTACVLLFIDWCIKRIKKKKSL
ncbi:hypothetical protein [Butyrivibrio sp. AC2005]|uniref:hypothetical protein n=1 Tax=Butyrivibrio sp. AC2005 TaxID=1280672 RepID=UPI0004786DE1|nr:hypothetical protein [Butyrivibrio sp. AC2005]